MIPAEVIRRKRDGRSLTGEELGAFFDAYLAGDVPDYQAAALLMAVYFRGLDHGESDALVRTMIESGRSLDLAHLPGPRVDKHSTGGIGDKVSLALAPLAAALGLFVPMIGGRGLGHTGGTLDKLEAIPGLRTDFDLGEFVGIVESVGCAIVGQSAEIAPLDRRLYALRDVTGTVSSIPLIAASIMSKKLAEDLNGLVLDVKVGSGAFIPDEEGARALATRMVEIGAQRGVPTRALLTAMDRPLGVAVGNGLEAAEAIECLRGDGPADLRELVLVEAAEMLLVVESGLTREVALKRATVALDNGAAMDRFVRMIEAQGGDATVVDATGRLAGAPERLEVRATHAGMIAEVAPRGLGEAVVRMGGGRARLDQSIDPRVGFEVHARPGDTLAVGDRLGIVHARSPADAESAAATLSASVRIEESGAPVICRPLVSERIDAESAGFDATGSEES